MEKDKPLALLISGLDGTGKLYYRQIEPLSKYYRVLPWEFFRRDAFDLKDLVEELVGSTADEKDGSMLVVGESFGGLIALQFALDYPGKIKNLALINTFPFYRRRVRIALACRWARLLQKPFIRNIKDWAAAWILATEGIPPEDRRRYLDVIRTIHHPAYCRRLQLVRDSDLRDRLHELRVPVHLFASGRDKIVPSIAAARLMKSAISGATLHEFPHAGHALLLTPGFNLADYFTG